jgi:hypothetical protein
VPRILLLLAIAVVVYILLARIKAMPPGKRKSEYIKLALIGALVVVVGLTLTGRMHWIGAALTGLLVAAQRMLPTLIRMIPALAALQSRRAQAAGQQSTVQTEVLRMVLDHDTGELHGEVLTGEFAGRKLDDLKREELDNLMAWCHQQDPDSVQLLSSYLQRRFGDAGDTAGSPPPSSSQMSRKEALDILGLAEGASAEEVVAAHRKLMQKLHPDRGGNDYLAAKVNQAKEVLLD